MRMSQWFQNLLKDGVLGQYLADHLIETAAPPDPGTETIAVLDVKYGVQQPFYNLPEPTWNPDATRPVVLFKTGGLNEPDPDTVDRWEELATALAKQSGHLDGPTVPELHDEPKVRLNNGWLYSTNVARIGGRHTGSDGTFYVPDSAQDTAAPSSSRHMGYRLQRPPNYGDAVAKHSGSEPQVVPHRGWNPG